MGPLPFIENKGEKTLARFILSFLLTSGCVGLLNAQTKDSVDLSADLWPAIETRLDQQPADTAFHFILELIREHCRDDDNCRFHTGKSIMFQLERRFNLMGAVYIAKDVLNITKEQEDFERQGGVYLNLSRYHGELGIHQRAAEYLDLALEAFQKEGSYMAIVETKMTKLEQSSRFRKPEEYLPEMDALLAEAVKMNDSRAICFLHARILGFKIRTGRLDEALAHINAIETMTSPFSSRVNSRAMYLTAVRARGIIAMMKNDRAEAEKHFLKALQLCEKTPNTWMEVNLLDKLTEIAWDRGDADQAKAYLDRAHEKAMEQQVDNLLEITYEWKAYIAEKESRFADALEYTREMHKHRDNYSARSAGFNLENYYLQQEKEQLAVEKENRDLELQLRKGQLRSSLIIIGLALFLALALAFAFNNQRKRKRELATQNALIKQQAGQLKELDTAKTRFFANVSHELRTPLTLIRGPIGSLLDGNGLTEKQTHLLQLADKSGKQLQQLVTEILDLGKLDLGKLQPNPKPTELSTFFGSYFAQFESLAERKEIDFSYEIGPPPGLTAGIDREKCRQIVYNLLSNAFKFTPKKGKIAAKLSVTDGILHLSVSDTGPGIHPNDLPHIFDRYFQSNRPGKPIEGGTGIGLAICSEYAKLFGGKIEADSRLGEGTVFEVSFPVIAGESLQSPVGSGQSSVGRGQSSVGSWQGAVGSPQPAEDIPEGTRSLILVVEDNPDLRDYIEMVLSSKYDVITAENGRAALDKLSSTVHRPPSLILSDLMMPVMDGFQLLETLKSHDETRHIPVIMLTARAEMRDKLKALRIGVDDYLTKPFDEEELLVRIANLLKNQALRSKEARAQSAEETDGPILSTPDADWLETFESYVQNHLSEEILSVPALADEMAMSESTLLRQLKRLTGLTPIQYLQEVRLDKARALLENGGYQSVMQLASDVGYTDARNFSRQFKKRFGKSPSEF